MKKLLSIAALLGVMSGAASAAPYVMPSNQPGALTPYDIQPVYSVENHPNDSRVKIDNEGKVQALTSRMGTGGGNVPMVMQCYSKSKRAQSATDYETWVESETSNTLNAFDVGDVRTTEMVLNGYRESALCYSTNHGTFHTQAEEGICATLQASDYKDPPTACYAVDCRNATEDSINGALQSNSAHSLNGNNVVRTRYIVRRLTPLECERLQGYPDGWTQIGEVVGYDRQVDEQTGEEYVQAIYEYIDDNGKKRKTSDAARYKALGNSIALPPWKWVLKRLCACYERDATMASLFDGIGGFPYLWEQLNGKGTCLWASEIEEFPIAVTKVRIGE
jgi:site-specific DNA-cytosine methylase